MNSSYETAAKILVVDDDPKIQYAFQEVLKKDGHFVILANNGEEALKSVQTSKIDLIFLDISLPHINGLEVLRRLGSLEINIPTIIITGNGTMQNAVKAMQLGAFDYLTKPLDISKIRELIKKALAKTVETYDDSSNNLFTSAENFEEHNLIGKSPAMQEVYKLIGMVSTSPNIFPVLITGESGTGKELVARAIHKSTSSNSTPFIGINCSAVPDNLLESELFGYEKGAFTNALERKLGKFEIAQNGTIFLDEIGNLLPGLQQKLLRVLQEREFERIGGSTLIKINARIISATNRDLQQEISIGNFREDLFYRLNAISIKLPSLRSHPEDIPLLASYLLKKYNKHFNKRIEGFSLEAMDKLITYQYPGNVRELENIIKRSVMMARGEKITSELLDKTFGFYIEKNTILPIVDPTFKKSREYVLQMFEKQFIEEKLSTHRGNVTAASEESDMTRQNFQRMMKKYDIKSGNFK
ncbi:MAG TPA: sigma-54 dependent transcriptional regulator [Ignavibacteriaceae bacterium]|nr:sigma-54 dependent transcriptional regulator [Ignavibacteriaceae bacterium]